MRSTCLYCERDGVTTPLVPWLHWGLCPIHSAKYLAPLAPATENAKERMDRAEADRRRG